MLHKGTATRSKLDAVNQTGTETAGGETGFARVMEPNDWPLDSASAAALVARAIDDIDESSEEDQCTLLSELLCAAWGSLWAQNQ